MGHDEINASAELLVRRLEANGTSGTVLVGTEGRVSYSRGFGAADRENGLSCWSDTVYCIGSLTKQFTAAAVLCLESMGRLSTADPLGDFLDVSASDKTALTLHQLATHTAGLVDVLGDDYEPLTRDGMVEQAAATPLVSRPGVEFRYSNLGYSLLAAVVEVVSGLPYEHALSEHLFAPAGMRSTGYVLPDWDQEDLAIGYQDGRRWGSPLEHTWDSDGPYWNLRGNGGLLSTSLEMFRWHVALQQGTVLTPEIRERLAAPQVPMSTGNSYGYGWVLQQETGGNRIARHAGSNGVMFADIVRLLDEDAMIFVATNDVSGFGGPQNVSVADELLHLVRNHR